MCVGVLCLCDSDVHNFVLRNLISMGFLGCLNVLLLISDKFVFEKSMCSSSHYQEVVIVITPKARSDKKWSKV